MDHINTAAHSNDEPVSPTFTTNLTLDPATWAAASAVGKWVGEKVAGAIVGAAAGKVFSEVMDAIGLGGPDLVGRLDNISNQLVQVQKSLDQLTKLTNEILKQLAELKQAIEKGLKIQTLVAAMTRIDEAYGPEPSALSGEREAALSISLRQLVETLPHNPAITRDDLEKAAKGFAADVGDIRNHIATINNVLAKQAFGQESLLMYWARELSNQIKDKKIERERAYLILEGYFLQAISTQLKGVSVHCVGLGTDKLGPQLIEDYLKNNFAGKMAEQTAAFIEAVEFLIFSTLAPTMPTGMQNGMGEREFPKHVDEILLRADLISAALNLVGHKPDSAGKPSPSIQAAIQGIYGRVLLRPSDLNNGAPPVLALAGYPAVAGAVVRKLPFSCVDLIESGGKAVLSDAATSFVTVAHYFWPFPAALPEAGKPIDAAQRGGVTPARYPVFGSDQPVLAASVFDVSRLYRGLPSSMQPSYEYYKFPGGYAYIGFYDESCKVYHNPLTNHSGDAFETFFTVVNIYKAETGQHSLVVQPLFKYTGAPAKVRLTAHVGSDIHRNPRQDAHVGGTAFAQWWEVYSRLKLKHSKGGEKEFFNSVDSYGYNCPISISSVTSPSLYKFEEPYDASCSGFFSIDFDLEPGDYSLMFDSEAAFHHSEEYQGWQSTSLRFYLHGLSLERV